MDAHALLTGQGWRGKGHSLHATDDSIGLSKPLLLNRKDNTKGLGTKAHFTSDTWWMNAFDEQLQGLDTSKKGQVTQTVTQGRLNQIEKVSGGKWMLYASFVRGGFLEGTIHRAEREAEESGASTPETESSSESEEDVKHKEKKEKGETREERRARKAAKKARKLARTARREARAAKKAEKEKAKGKDRKESKEERRARREAKKAKREARKAKKGVSG
ncbi:hypothetical protein CCHL11_08363 [Colletotrichum chlorophyti]|uniref:Protein TMA23 n=1 Tax=Colletotrichum chlorophyti TaxID=708187 RepID=A0A1Q8RF12_9PEZI|nr:hypothetical protein CCHL11_08363 [Colletotrichum chlorophyti]